jgi:leader peptidase (prepilin peptidase) / N-methyltransferase
MHVDQYVGGTLDVTAMSLLGALVGFIVVRVSRWLPERLERQWTAQSSELMLEAGGVRVTPVAATTDQMQDTAPAVPSTRLRIGLLICTTLFAWCGWRWGVTWTGLMWAGFGAALICLALIDWETMLLPDAITLPLLWVGLCAASLGFTGVKLEHALWGAAAGYLLLWSIYWVTFLTTGQETMGYGDFKFLAALGAWFGLPLLMPLVLISSISCVLVLLWLARAEAHPKERYKPFGPFISFAGLLTLVLTPGQVLALIGL